MTPNFALVLSFQTIRLLDRVPDGWAELTRADLTDGAFDTAMAHLRREAEATGQMLTCSVLLPLEQVKFLTVDAPLDQAGVRRAMTGATPYRLSELIIDWMQEGPQTYIAACAHETLQEAEAVIAGAGFEPISLGAIPPSGSFPREVWFGPCRGADTPAPDAPFAEVPRPEAVFGSRSGAVAQGVSVPRRLSLGATGCLSQARAAGLVDPAPDQNTHSGLERAARAGLIDDVPDATAAAPAHKPPLDRTKPQRDGAGHAGMGAAGASLAKASSSDAAVVNPAPRTASAPAPATADGALAPGAANPPASAAAANLSASAPAANLSASAPAANLSASAPAANLSASAPAANLSASAPADGALAPGAAAGNDAPADLPPPDTLTQEATASLTALRAVPAFDTPQAHAEALHRRSLWPLGLAAVAVTAVVGGLWWTSRGGELPGFQTSDVDTPVDVAVVTDVPAPVGTTPAPTRPVAQPSPQATAGQASLSQSPTAGAVPSVELSAPERLGSVVASDTIETPTAPDGLDALAGDDALGDVLSPDEARRVYAATGVWLRAPRSGAQPLGPTDFTRPSDRITPARVIRAQAPDTTGLPPRAVSPPQPVLPRDQVFVLDARGVVPATVEGAKTPFGALAYLGVPPGAPKFRPLPIGPMDDIPEGFNPRPRPPRADSTAIDAALQQANAPENATPEDAPVGSAPSESAPVENTPPENAPAENDDQSALPQPSEPDALQQATLTPDTASPTQAATPPTAQAPDQTASAAAPAAPDQAISPPTAPTTQAAQNGLAPPPRAPRIAAATAEPPTTPEVTRAPGTGGVALTAVGGVAPPAERAQDPADTGASQASVAAAGAVGLALLTTPLPPERPPELAPPPASSVVPQRRPAGLDVTPSRPAVTVATAQVARPSGPVNRSVAARATQENVLNLRKFNLISVSGKSGSRAALVRAPNGRVSRVKVGDRLDGGRVRAIDQGSLRYLKRGRTITLRMPNG